MSAERDELALELFIGDNSNQPRESSVQDWTWFKVSGRQQGQVEHYKAMAAAALAAGYRKPRIITTLDDLSVLEPGSVLQGPDFHEETYKCTAPGTFHAIAAPTEYRPSELVARGPFALIYDPEGS